MLLPPAVALQQRFLFATFPQWSPLIKCWTEHIYIVNGIRPPIARGTSHVYCPVKQNRSARMIAEQCHLVTDWRAIEERFEQSEISFAKRDRDRQSTSSSFCSLSGHFPVCSSLLVSVAKCTQIWIPKSEFLHVGSHDPDSLPGFATPRPQPRTCQGRAPV